MSAPITDGQLRILRNARDGIEAPACFFRPLGYFLDVEHLVRSGMATAHGNAIALTPLGASRLAEGQFVAEVSWG